MFVLLKYDKACFLSRFQSKQAQRNRLTKFYLDLGSKEDGQLQKQAELVRMKKTMPKRFI